MQISTDSDPFFFPSNEGSPCSAPSLFLKENSDLFSSEEPFDLTSKKIIQRKDILQDNIEMRNIFRWVEIADKILIVAPLIEATEEEAEQALIENKLVRMGKTEEGTSVFKFSEERTKEMESLGVTTVQVREPSGGIRTYTSFHFQTLDENELKELITYVKTYIVFLKTLADPDDPNTEKAIQHLELKLEHLEIERAIKTKDPGLEELLGGLVKTSPYKVAMQLAEIWAYQKIIREKREEEAEQNFWETKHTIILKEISRSELQISVIKEAVLKGEVHSHHLLNGFVKQEAVNKKLINIGFFINTYHTLNRVKSA